MIVFRKGANACILPDKGTKHKTAIMGADELEFSFVSDSAVDLQEGDYIHYEGVDYSLNREAEYTIKLENQYNYDSVIFEHPVYLFFNKILTHKLTGSHNFTLTGKLADFVNLIIWNINKDDNPLGVDSGWSAGSILDTGFKTLSFEGVNCKDALNKLASDFGCEFTVSGKVLNFVQKLERNTGLIFSQGKGKGLYELTQRNVDKNDVVTRIFPVGGNKNVPKANADEQGRLKLPEMYLENFSEVSRIVERNVVFNDIFPHFEGAITSVSGENNTSIACPEIDFDLNVIAVGDNARINFLTGDLMGGSFKFAYNNATKIITLVPQTDDVSLPDETGNKPIIPSAKKKANVGDKFNFTGVIMPDSYVVKGISKLRDRAVSWLSFHSRKRIKFELVIDYRFMRGKRKLEVGDLITVNAKGESYDIRITAIERNVQNGSVTATVSNYLDESWEKIVEGKINEIQHTVNAGPGPSELIVAKQLSEQGGYLYVNGQKTKSGFSDKSIYAEKAGFSDRSAISDRAIESDHSLRADIADNAYHADEADHALKADDSTLWAGRKFADYLDQPVRKSDPVTFDRITPFNYLGLPADKAEGLSFNATKYLLLAGEKIKSGYSDDSDKWDGSHKAEYLDQPVRVNDEVSFRKIRVPEIVSPSFVSGAFGAGFRMWNENGNSFAEVDNLSVRKEFTTTVLNIREILGTGGAFAITNVAKIDSVTEYPTYFSCVIDTQDNTVFVPFRAGDIITCQRWEGKSKKYYRGVVVAVSQSIFDVAKPLMEGLGKPAKGDSVFQMGNTTDTTRQGLIYLTNSDTGAPFMDVYDGINSASMVDKIKVRLGKLDGIEDPDLNPKGYGLYTNNIYAKGVFKVLAGSNVPTLDEFGKYKDAVSTRFEVTDQAISQKLSATVFTDTIAGLPTKTDIKTAIDAIQVGGRNYYSNSTLLTPSGNLWFIGRNTEAEDCKNGFRVAGALDGLSELRLSNVIKSNGFWTVSGWVRGVQFIPAMFFNVNICDLPLIRVQWESGNNDWYYFTVTQYVDRYSEVYNFVDIGIPLNLYYHFKDIKVEQGTKATSWTPAPEDVAAGITDAKKAGTDASAEAKQAQQAANAANNYISNVLPDRLSSIEDALDGLLEQHFKTYDPTAANEPASQWTTPAQKEDHLGDLFYNTSNGKSWRWVKDGITYKWQEIINSDLQAALQAAAKAQDTADSKRRVFTVTPFVPYDKGDLWVQGADGDVLMCVASKTLGQSYVAGDWVKASKYTDDTKANQVGNDLAQYKTVVTGQIETTAAGQISNFKRDVFDLLGARVQSAENKLTVTADGLSQLSTKVQGNTTNIGELVATSEAFSSRITTVETTKADTSTVNQGLTNAIQTASTDAANKANQALADAKLEIGKIQVGGRNLFKYSEVPHVHSYGTDGSSNVTEVATPVGPATSVGSISNNGYIYFVFNQRLTTPLIVGKKYTISVDLINTTTPIRFDIGGNNLSPNLSGERVSWDFVHKEPVNPVVIIRVGPSGWSARFRCLQIEQGNKATDWSPAPEDFLEITTKHTSDIQNLGDAVLLRAEKTVTDALGQRLSTAESNLTVASQGINGLVTKTDAQGTAIANLKIQADNIVLRVAQDAQIKDTRNDNQPPSWYYANYPRRTVREFKYTSVIGLTGLATYCILETNVKWIDPSGGRVEQTAVVDGRVFTRAGSTDTWSPWVESESTVGATNKANKAYTDATAFTSAQIKLTNDSITSAVQKIDLQGTRLSSVEIKADGIINRVASTEGSIASLSSTVEQQDRAIKLKVEAGDIKTAIDAIQVGGRNLFKYSEVPHVHSYGTDGSSNVTEVATPVGPATSVGSISNNGYIYFVFNQRLTTPLIVGKKYTISVDLINTTTPIRFDIGGNNLSPNLSGERVSWDFVHKEPVNPVVIIRVGPSGWSARFRCLQIEQGNKATDWSPAIEDTTAQIDAAKQAGTTALSEIAVERGRITSIVAEVSSEKVRLSGTITTLDSITSRVAEVEIPSSSNNLLKYSEVPHLNLNLFSEKVTVSQEILGGLPYTYIASTDTANNGHVYFSMDYLTEKLVVGRTYTISALVWAGTPIAFVIGGNNGSDKIQPTTSPQRVSYTFIHKTPLYNVFYLYVFNKGWSANFRELQIQEGKRVTPWNLTTQELSERAASNFTQIQQTKDDLSFNVVKKNNVLASINASSEGVKMRGDKIELNSLNAEINASQSFKVQASKINLTGAVTISHLAKSASGDALLNVEGKIKADKIDVNQLFAVEATATNLTVTGNSKLGGFTVKGNSLENTYTTTALRFTRLSDSDETWLRINDSNTAPVLAIRTDQPQRIGINIETYAWGATGINVLANLGGKAAIRSVGSHEFYVRPSERWNAPGVLAAFQLYNDVNMTFKQWGTAPIAFIWKERINDFIIKVTHDLGHTDYIPFISNIFAGGDVITHSEVGPNSFIVDFKKRYIGGVNILIIGSNSLYP